MEQYKQETLSDDETYEGTQEGTAGQINPHDIGYPFFTEGKILGLEPFPETIFTAEGSGHEPPDITPIPDLVDIEFGPAKIDGQPGYCQDEVASDEVGQPGSDLEYPPTSFELLEQVLDGSPEADQD